MEGLHSAGSAGGGGRGARATRMVSLGGASSTFVLNPFLLETHFSASFFRDSAILNHF